MNYLSTKVSTSRQKKFSLVMFVDTPGLVDGDMNYPFNVDDLIVLLGRFVCSYMWKGYVYSVLCTRYVSNLRE